MSAIAPTGLLPARILVVDDEAHGRLALQELLEGPDREVIAASSGEAALRLAAATDFALVLLDVRMAGMDGFETARLIHQCPRSERTPIIFLTGAYEDMGSVVRGYAAGAVDYVVKPFLPEVLRSKVAVFVDLHYKNAELARQIQERRKAEEALSRANEQLEAKIRERTESLTIANELLRNEVVMRRRMEEELREAKQSAEAANVAKTEFLANMSHEIRTPMNAIVGMTELALQANPSAEMHEYLSAVKVSSASLLNIIDDILDLSKIEAGRLTVESVPFSLRECAGDALRTLALQAHDKGLELVCDVDAAVPDAVVGDPLRLRQIVINLVGNGIKFTPRGEVVLRVEQEPSDESEVACHFSVRDTGIGIPMDRQGAIFRRFLQGDASTTRLYGGSGLGLTISARLVEMMRGRIWVESEPEKGSVFHFTARFGRQHAACREPEVTDLRGARILVVDDHPLSRRIIADALREWGANVEAAEGTEAARRLLRAAKRTGRPFRTVVLDDSLPGADSYALAGHIARGRGYGAPAVVMVGFGARSNAPGIVALTKPVKRAELLEAVKSVPVIALQPEAAPAATAPARATGALRILLVEDNALSQKLAYYVLRKQGHEVIAAGDGVAALEVHEREPLDVILMDVRMPRMDGLQATMAIRARERNTGAHVPIIALTANAMTADREACLKAGMDECLIKPIQPAALLAAIERQHTKSAAQPPVVVSCGRKAVLDQAALFARLDGDRDLLDAMAAAYFRDCDRLMAQSRLALTRGDAEGLASALHTLCGMFRNLSAEAAGDAVSNLQQLDIRNDPAVAAARFSTLEEEVRLLNEKLAGLCTWPPRARAVRHRRSTSHAKPLG